MHVPFKLRSHHGNLWERGFSPESLRISFPLSGSFVRALAVPISVLTAPFLFVSLFVLAVKPNGPIGQESNTTFWLLATIALGFSLVLGVASLIWLIRLISFLVSALRRQQFVLDHEDLLADIASELDWIDSVSAPEVVRS